MSDFVIELSIQEMVKDFEEIVRYDERLGVLFDLEKASEKNINNFYKYMIFICKKYIPNYEDHLGDEYYSPSSTEYDNALMLYELLYENFKEIFYNLV